MMKGRCLRAALHPKQIQGTKQGYETKTAGTDYKY